MFFFLAERDLEHVWENNILFVLGEMKDFVFYVLLFEIW